MLSAKMAGNRRDGMKRLLMDLIKLNKVKYDLRHGHFAVLDVSRSEQTALIWSTDQSLSSVRGASLFFFTVINTLNYSLILICYGLKIKKQTVRPKSDFAVFVIWSGSTLFRNYLINSGTNISQTALKKKKKKTHQKTDAFKQCTL